MAILEVTNNRDGGSGSLREAVIKAKSGDTIQFDSSLSDRTITLSSGLWLNKSLTFDGGNAPGLTISGGNKTNIFWMGGVEADLNLTVKDLTLADSYYEADAGGAIWAQENSNIVIENVNFENNVSDGAALHAQQGSFITVNNSNFDSNDGASISDKEYSTGAISLFAFGELKVSDSTFTNNKGFNGGAIHVTSSDLFVENSTFIGNDSTPGKNRDNFIPGAGGAIYADAASVPNDEKFYGQLPQHELQGEAEGGTISINNSYFEKNRASGQGGALALWGYSQDKVIVTNNTIIDNEVIKNKDNMAQGGGVWLMGYGEVDSNKIANNKSADLGGGLFIWGEVPTQVSNTTFSDNQAQKGGAIYNDLWDGQLEIGSVKFDSNSANDGGVVFSNKIRPVYIENSQFVGNGTDDIADVNFANDTANAVLGTNAADALSGTKRNSYLFGLEGHDTLDGGDGNDYLDGDKNNDVLYGGVGNDTLIGGGQNNTLFGQAGNDVFIGGNGQDIIEGGSGRDRFVLGDENKVYYTNQNWYDHAIIKDFEPQQDTIQLKGSASDYTIQPANSQGINGAGIFYQGGMIALIGNMSPKNFSLNGDYVIYGSPVDNNINSDTPVPVESSDISSGLELNQDSLFSNRPKYNASQQNGLIVWNNNDVWHMEATGTEGGSRFQGRIVAENPIEDLSFFKIENHDRVEFADDSRKVLEFDLRIAQRWTDGISFKVPDRTSVFLELEDSDSVSVKAGADLQEINLSEF